MQEYVNIRFTERTDKTPGFFGIQCQQYDHVPASLSVSDWALIEAGAPGVCPKTIAAAMALFSPICEHRFTADTDEDGKHCFRLEDSARPILELYDLYLSWPARLEKLCVGATIKGEYPDLISVRAWLIYIGDNMESILTEAPTVAIYCASHTNLYIATQSKKETPFEIYRDHCAKWPSRTFEADMIVMIQNLPVTLLEHPTLHDTDMAQSAIFAILAAYVNTQAILTCTITSDFAAVSSWCPPNSIFYSCVPETRLTAFNVGGAITIVDGSALSVVYYYIQAMHSQYPDNIYIQSAFNAISL